MIKKIFCAFLIILSTASFAREASPPVVIQSVTQLLPLLHSRFDELQSGDLLILDLDNTVFREMQMLGTDEWYSFALERHMAQTGLGKHAASDDMEPINRAIKEASEMRLLEPALPQLIRRLQMRGVFVLGLTARHPNLADITIRHLRGLGIDFSKTVFPGERLNGDRLGELHNAFLFRDNIAFTDGSPKGLVLKHIIRKTEIHPRHAIAIDDRIHHVHTMVEALLDLHISAFVIHYLKVREEAPFDAEVADMQLKVFQTQGRIPSDEEARSLLEVGNCERKLSRP